MSSPAEHAGPNPERADADRSEYAGDRLAAIRDGVATYGEAFLAYLTLPNVNVIDPQIIKHFIDVYGGYYEDRRAFVDGQIESLGWTAALTAFREAEGIWEDDLLWNYDELWRHCLEVYSVNERFGGVHVFFN